MDTVQLRKIPWLRAVSNSDTEVKLIPDTLSLPKEVKVQSPAIKPYPHILRPNPNYRLFMCINVWQDCSARRYRDPYCYCQPWRNQSMLRTTATLTQKPIAVLILELLRDRRVNRKWDVSFLILFWKSMILVSLKLLNFAYALIYELFK